MISRSILAVLSLFCHITATSYFLFFFFNDTATTEIYTLSLHDALPIYPCMKNDKKHIHQYTAFFEANEHGGDTMKIGGHTSENQALTNLVMRSLFLKKKKNYIHITIRNDVLYTPGHRLHRILHSTVK